MTASTLSDLLEGRQGPFLDRGRSGSPLTYEETRALAARMRSFFRSREIVRGETVAVAMANSAEAGAIWFGLLSEGISVVPLNAALPDEEIAYILRMAEVKMVLADRHTIARAQRWTEEIVTRTEAINAEEAPWNEYSEVPRRYIDLEDIAIIFFTSGTTGRPKGAMLSHRALLENAAACGRTYGLDAAAGFACPIPIFHSFAATVCLFLPAVLGGRTYLHSALDLPGFLSSLPLLEGRRILVAVPSLIEALTRPGAPPLANIRYTVSGGAALPLDLRARVSEATGAPVHEGYGTTECGPVITSQSPGRESAPGSVGRPIDGVCVEIRSGDGETVRTGEVGEIVVQTPGLMSGYYDLAAATRASIKGGWFSTGDLGYLLENGELYIVDRLTDAITVKGITVLPQRIEQVLLDHPGVAEVAVVGIPDGAGGEAPWAFVRPRTRPGEPPPDPAELIAFARNRLPVYATPRAIEYRDTLPKTITGKILKRTLRQKWL